MKTNLVFFIRMDSVHIKEKKFFFNAKAETQGSLKFCLDILIRKFHVILLKYVRKASHVRRKNCHSGC